jgi:hypothetical protein
LQGNIERAKEMLAEAEGRLIGLRTLEGRLQYQIAGAAIWTLLFVPLSRRRGVIDCSRLDP